MSEEQWSRGGGQGRVYGTTARSTARHTARHEARYTTHPTARTHGTVVQQRHTALALARPHGKSTQYDYTARLPHDHTARPKTLSHDMVTQPGHTHGLTKRHLHGHTIYPLNFLNI